MLIIKQVFCFYFFYQYFLKKNIFLSINVLTRTIIVFFFVFQNYLKARYIIYLAHNEKGDLVTGDSNGTIYVWSDGGNKITNFVKHAHEVIYIIFSAIIPSMHMK